MSRRSIAVALLAAFPVALTAQRTHVVGEHGAQVVLPAGWKREKHTDGYGDFQFVVDAKRSWLSQPKRVWLTVREHRGALETEADLVAALDQLDRLPAGTKLQVVAEADWRRATRAANLATDGWDGAYRSDLLVVDGLAWHVFAWARHGDEELLGDQVEQFLDGFELPGAASEWHRGLQPQREQIERGTVTVSFEVRPFVLRRADEKGTLRRYRTADDRQGFQVWEATAASPAQALARELDVMTTAYGNYRETGRRSRTIDGVACVEQTAVTDHYAYRLLVVPVGARRMLHVRHFAYLPADAPRRDRDLLFDSVRVTTLAGDAGLPPLPPPPPRAVDQPAARRTFLAGATLLHETAGWGTGWARAQSGGWAFAGSHGAVAFGPDGATTALLPELQYPHALVEWRDAWWVGAAGRGIRRAAPAGDDAGDAPIAGNTFARAGDDLVCARARPPAWLGGSAPQAAEVVVRRPSGEERTVALLPETWVIALAADRGAALVAVGDASGFRGHGARLLLLDLADGTQRELPGWTAVDALAAGEHGWLVTGAPAGEPRGVWRLPATGAPELLVAGLGLTGVDLAGDRVFLAATSGNVAQLWSAALAHCRDAGARSLTVTAAQLEALGAALLRARPAAPRTRVELDAALAQLQALARAQLGAELPGGPGDVQAMLGGVMAGGRAQLGAGCRIALALLVANHLVAAGGQWVDGGDGSWNDWLVARDVHRQTPFAWALHPGAAVVDALDGNGSGPSSDVLARQGRGRTLFVGADGAALARRVEAGVPAPFDSACDRGDVKELAAILAAAPANTAARAVAYARLADAGRWTQLAELARPFAEREDAAAEDTLAAAQAASELATPADGERLLRELQAAVHRHPREAGLYVLLGRARERFEPAQPRRARACYDRVVELGGHGTAADEARAALQRLDGK